MYAYVIVYICMPYHLFLTYNTNLYFFKRNLYIFMLKSETFFSHSEDMYVTIIFKNFRKTDLTLSIIQLQCYSSQLPMISK